MRIQSLPGCCTATVVAELGGTTVAQGNVAHHEEDDIDHYLKLVEERMKSIHAMIITTTNNEQTIANKVLKDRGYIGSPWMSKGQHPQTKVCLWYKNLRPIEE